MTAAPSGSTSTTGQHSLDRLAFGLGHLQLPVLFNLDPDRDVLTVKGLVWRQVFIRTLGSLFTVLTGANRKQMMLILQEVGIALTLGF